MDASIVLDAQLLHRTEDFVQCALASHDSSHDIWHIRRVRANAKMLAEAEGLTADATRLVELCALLHDVHDWKYSGDASATQTSVKAFLEQQAAPPALIAKVLTIIGSVGFKDELRSSTVSTASAAQEVASGQAPAAHSEPGAGLSIEAAVLQDADRLDAIGAVGIARCFTFGGHFSRTLHDPDVPPRTNLTKEQYMAESARATTINHFYEKLLKLSAMMKTAAGRRAAQQRHDFMLQYLEQFHAEWEGRR
ncbi:hypothetical protein V8C86DRAFT_2525419 [Haematococcus lacustris]